MIVTDGSIEEQRTRDTQDDGKYEDKAPDTLEERGGDWTGTLRQDDTNLDTGSGVARDIVVCPVTLQCCHLWRGNAGYAEIKKMMMTGYLVPGSILVETWSTHTDSMMVTRSLCQEWRGISWCLIALLWRHLWERNVGAVQARLQHYTLLIINV